MKHGTIIKKINELFSTWTTSKVHLDSSEEVKHKDPYISIQYEPSFGEQKYLGNNPRAFKYSGTLRIYIYEKNQTKNLVLMDSVINYLKNKELNGIKFTELEGLGNPKRDNANELYVSFVDFEACLIF
jgi:hypothetical protein